MATIIAASIVAVFFVLTFVAWRRYLWAAEKVPQADTCPYSLTDVFGDSHLVNVPHQKGIRWLTEVFSRSAERFPHLPALQIPHTGESLTFAELDARAETRGCGRLLLSSPARTRSWPWPCRRTTGKSWRLTSAFSRPAVP